MQYLSPARFVQNTNTQAFDSISEEDFQRMVSDSFQYKERIAIGDYNYTKENLLTLTERSEFLEFVRCNLIVSQSDDLLEFLESGKLKTNASLSKISALLSEDTGLREYLKPFLVDSIKKALSEGLDSYHYYDVALIIMFAVKQELDMDTDCLAPIRLYLDESIEFFSNLTEHSYHHNAKKLEPWTSYQWNRILNALPDSFEAEKVKLSGAIFDFSTSVLTEAPYLVKDLHKYLCQVKELGAHLREGIEKQSELFDSLYEYEKVEEESNSPWRLVISILVLVIAFIRLLSTCS